MAKLRKIFTISVMAITVLSMSVVVAPDVNAAATAGDLIKTDAYSTVYYLGDDGKRYGFPNEATFFSWFDDFSGVMTVAQDELESYRVAGMITMRPGTKLVKIQSDPRVYAVEPGGALNWIDSEATALALYGSAWNTIIVDVPDAFIGNYSVNGVAYGNSTDADISATALDGSVYPAGSVVQWEGSDDVYYIDADGQAQKFADEAAMSANRFSMSDVITATSVVMPALGTEITGADANLTNPVLGSSTSGTQVVGASGLSVALASDTPASATVITYGSATAGYNGQAMVPFLKMNFTASADGDAKITSVKLNRKGISSDTDIDGLYLYDGTTRLTDATALTSNTVTFNNASGIFTVPAGTTKAITVYGDMYYGASSGKTIGLSLDSAVNVTSNAVTVSGSFPLTGNLMSTAAVTDLGRITVGSYTAPASDQTPITPGDSEQEVWKFTLTSAEQALSVEKLVLTAVGSIQSTDLVDFALYVNSEKIADVAAMNASNQVIFDLSATPIAIAKGANKSISLRAKVTGGSTRTFYFSFQNQNDIVVKDTNYNIYVEPYTDGSWAVIKPTEEYYVSAGSLSVSRATESPTEDVVLDGTNVVLGIFDFRAAGENIKVKNLDVSVDTTGVVKGGIDNAKVYVNDVQVGTTKDLTDTAATAYDGTGDEVNFTFGSTFIVEAGATAKVKIIGDIKTATSTSFSGNETLTVNVEVNADNCQQMTSLGALTAPATAVAGNALNVTAAALVVSKYSGYGDQTVVAGTNAVKLGSFVVTAGASEGIDVSSITVTLGTNEYGTVTNMYLADATTGEQMGDMKVTPAASNIINASFSLAASQGKVINLMGNIKSGSNPGTWIAGVDADGTGKVTGSAVSATVSDNNMQTITVGSGTLTASNGSQPAGTLLLAGSTDNKVASFRLTSANESYTVEKLELKMKNGFATSTAAVKIKYTNAAGTAKTAAGLLTFSDTQGYATATFTGLDMYVPKDQDSNIDVYLDMAYLSANGVSGADTAIYLDWNNGFRAVGSSGTVKTTVGTADLNGNTFYNRKTKITFAQQALTSSPASGTIFKFTVVADSKGNAEIKQLGFTVTTVACEVRSVYLYDVDNEEQLTDTPVSDDNNDTFVKLLVGNSVGDDDVITVGTTAKTIEVRSTVTNYSASGDSITVRFKKDTTAVPGSSSADLNGSYYNVWSDRSAASHTTITTDWTTGNLLKNMDDAQTFTVA